MKSDEIDLHHEVDLHEVDLMEIGFLKIDFMKSISMEPISMEIGFLKIDFMKIAWMKIFTCYSARGLRRQAIKYPGNRKCSASLLDYDIGPPDSYVRVLSSKPYEVCVPYDTLLLQENIARPLTPIRSFTASNRLQGHGENRKFR